MISEEGRSNAKKVLVVVSDRSSRSTDKEIQNALKPLQDNNVIVIPVALGVTADERQLRLLTDDESSFMTAKTTDDTSETKNKLMVIVFKGLFDTNVKFTQKNYANVKRLHFSPVLTRDGKVMKNYCTDAFVPNRPCSRSSGA